MKGKGTDDAFYSKRDSARALEISLCLDSLWKQTQRAAGFADGGAGRWAMFARAGQRYIYFNRIVLLLALYTVNIQYQ